MKYISCSDTRYTEYTKKLKKFNQSRHQTNIMNQISWISFLFNEDAKRSKTEFMKWHMQGKDVRVIYTNINQRFCNNFLFYNYYAVAYATSNDAHKKVNCTHMDHQRRYLLRSLVTWTHEIFFHRIYNKTPQ